MQSALFIGRFQPLHNGHLEVIKEILKENERVIIVIGSAEQGFLPDNPLTAGERFQIIEESLKAEKIPEEKYKIIPIRDINDYDNWVAHINKYLPPYTKVYTGSEIVKFCYKKYEMEIIELDRKLKTSASEIRKKMIENENWEEMVPNAVEKLLKKWDIPQRLKKINKNPSL